MMMRQTAQAVQTVLAVKHDKSLVKELLPKGSSL